MARRPRLFAPGLLYHVIVRGNQRQKTFLTDQDYQAYVERIARYRQKYGVTLYAYCLMPNHVHLLLECLDKPLGKFMQGLQQSYTQYFNRVHRKVGHLFQGRYKAIVCEKDEYLLGLIRYIHLNPVRAGLLRRPERYRYSGHCAYLRGDGKGLIKPSPILKMLGGRRGYETFVLDGIGDGHKEEFYQVEDQRFLGKEEFGERVRQQAGGKPAIHRNRPIGTVFDEVARKLKVHSGVLRGPDRAWGVSRKRALAAFVLVRRLGYRLGEVADYLGRDAASVSSLISRISERIESEASLARSVASLSKIA